MLAFQVLYGRSLRGVVPNVPQSKTPSTRARLFCTGGRRPLRRLWGWGWEWGNKAPGWSQLSVNSVSLSRQLAPVLGL